MTLSQEERYAIRQAVYEDLIEFEDKIMHQAGTYTFLCLLQGEPTFTHAPVGPVLRYIPPPSLRQAC